MAQTLNTIAIAFTSAALASGLWLAILGRVQFLLERRIIRLETGERYRDIFETHPMQGI